ncbi:MAG: hypothetical protein IPP32_10195 [Bacteroidetes bacterium]|nr:hypothetical protein [Bacteroidota bacterium]
MNFSLVTESPLWFSIFCVLAGLAYAALLYYRESKLIEVKPWLKVLLAIFRFTTVTLLAFLLLSPLLKTLFREVEKPVIVIAQDNSESIVIGKDSSFYRIDYRKNLNQLIQTLSNKYEVRTYSFGENLGTSIPFSFTEKQSDISAFLNEIDTRYSNRNLGAVVICSDGLYNKGEDPVFASTSIKAPIYTVALGDTTVKKDVVLTKVRHNRMAYLGNTFPVEITADARQYKGKSVQLSITKNEETVFTQALQITSDRFTSNIPVQIKAAEKGLQRYRVKLTTLPGEVTYSNNVQDIFIEVMDGREKVLLLAAAPHPDIAALKQAIESNENYELTVAWAADFNGSFSTYNLVILHQLPSETNSNPKLISDLAKSDVPLLYILGNQSNINAFNGLSAGLSIGDNRGKANESQGMLESAFSLFTLSDETRNFIPKLPPLLTPYGNYKQNNSSTTFISQKIGTVQTTYPLILFTDVNSRKTGVIAGEGIWRWRLADFEAHHNHTIFNELINKTVQYLSVKVDKSLFRILAKNNFFENEIIQFDAEVYNDSYELITDPEVSIEIITGDNKRFPFSFTKTANAYRLSATAFPVGEYKYEARVKVGEKLLTQRGIFTVSPLVVESINTTADHQLLYNLAQQHNGAMYYPSNLEALQNKLLQREDIKPVSYSEKKLMELINLKWVFFLLLTLLSLEWFLRKRNGSY